MERETYAKTIDGKELRLELWYEHRISSVELKEAADTAAAANSIAQLRVQEYPDRALLLIRSGDGEKAIDLTSTEYREVLRLFATAQRAPW